MYGWHFVVYACPFIKLYSSHPCGDSIKVYSGKIGANVLVQNICGFSNSTFDVKMSTRNAYVRFQTDGRRGRGTGFRGTFAAQGEHMFQLYCNLTPSIIIWLHKQNFIYIICVFGCL